MESLPNRASGLVDGDLSPYLVTRPPRLYQHLHLTRRCELTVSRGA
jgi:hypothetical protein